jgi:molecular chaperone DnaK
VATGKQQSIVIKASSGLSDEEIEKMVNDAESHAEEDKKFEALITARNTADGLVHATRKTLKEAEDKVEADEKEKIEAAITALEEVIKGDDLAEIEAKTKDLTEASGDLAQRMYAEAQAASEAAAGEAGAESSADDAVDAEFEEVKEDEK